MGASARSKVNCPTGHFTLSCAVRFPEGSVQLEEVCAVSCVCVLQVCSCARYVLTPCVQGLIKRSLCPGSCVGVWEVHVHDLPCVLRGVLQDGVCCVFSVAIAREHFYLMLMISGCLIIQCNFKINFPGHVCVRIAHRHQTQNQGDFRVIVVYSKTGSVSQVIKNAKPNVRQRIGIGVRKRVVYNQVNTVQRRIRLYRKTQQRVSINCFSIKQAYSQSATK